MAEPGRQHGAASRHQLLDDVGMRQERCLRDFAAITRLAADDQVEPLDTAALERPSTDTGDPRKRLQLLDHAVEMDHGAAPAEEIRSRGSSRVATDESRTRRPT